MKLLTSEIHFVEHCPVCGQGLVRIRVCTNESGSLFGFVICDECDSTWTDPSMKTPYIQSNPEKPVCPQSGTALWSESSHWADKAEMSLLGWYKRRKR